MNAPPQTLLGAARWDGLVPFLPAHWSDLRKRLPPDEMCVMDDVTALALDMSVRADTVMLSGKPAAIVGLWLAPDCGHPWVSSDPNLTIDQFAHVAGLCRPFLVECQALRPLLRVERTLFDDVTRLWLSLLGFCRAPAEPPLEVWELRPSAAVSGD